MVVVANVLGTFAFYIKGRKSTSYSTTVSSRMFGAETSLCIPACGSHPSTPIRLRYNYHVLLVEDNLINQKVLSKQLRGIGCTVHVANHGVEALDFLAKTTLWDDGPPSDQRMALSFILMDLEMPIMDGLTCCRRIRDLQREGKINCHVPIIAVTANARTEQMDVAIDAGMVCYFFPLYSTCLTDISIGRYRAQAVPYPRTNAEDRSSHVTAVNEV